MTKTGDYKIPFDSRGMMHYPETWRNEIEWRDNVPFRKLLRIDSYGRGQSAAYFNWVDEDGLAYPMFISDLTEMLRVRNVMNGEACGRWIARKRGKNYGIAAFDREVS
jgi:hypothetical protein